MTTFASTLENSRFKNLKEYYEAARKHSDKNFFILPDEENTAGYLGGHTDFVLSHPVYWNYSRQAGQSFVQDDPVYGKVYHLSTADEALALSAHLLRDFLAHRFAHHVRSAQRVAGELARD